jgi:periplasmic protein TonB
MPLQVAHQVSADPPSSRPNDAAAWRLPTPARAALARDPAVVNTQHARRSGQRAQMPGLRAAVLSLLAHAAVLLAAVGFLPGGAKPLAIRPEPGIALVFAPAAAVPPSAADAPLPDIADGAPASADRGEETSPAAPAPAPVAPPPPAAPVRAEDAPHAASEPPPPVQRPPPGQPAARARNGAGAPPGGRASSRPSEAAAQPSASESASPATPAALVPPRPVAGMATNRAPIYPEIARRRGEEGRVVLRVSVSADGVPLDVAVMGTSGHPSLDSAALSAVRQWQFIPAMQAGRSVPAVAEVPVRFQLSN